MAEKKRYATDQKTLVIGLDGSTFDVLDPYIRQGVLPNLERLIRNGVRGELEAAIPPVTGPSWVSFMTGMGPGNHGVFDFVQRLPHSIKRRPVTYQDIRSKTLWEILSESGRKVGVVNLPITYPAPEVNGYMIPGLLTPSEDGEFAFPAGLMSEIRGEVGEYVLDVWWQKYGESGVERFMEDLLHCTDQRIKTMQYLLENKDWDLFMGVFIGTDRIQHYLWSLIHPDPSRLTPREKGITERIAEYHRRVDRFFGYLLDHYGEEADIFVVSDHGFGPLGRKMYINRWLADQGFLTIQEDRTQRMSVKKRIVSALRPIVRALDIFGLRAKIGYRLRMIGRMSAYSFLDCIDWSTSRAYSASNTEQGIYLNVRGREPQGIVDPGGEYDRIRDEIIRRLRNLKDPETGNKMETLIFKREDLYHGPHMESAPDIILFVQDGECLIDVQLKGTLFEKAGWHTGSGTHRLEGILIAHGPRIKRGLTVQGTRIMDMAPTLLHLQGLPIPEGMDGKPLQQIFNDDFLAGHPISYAQDAELALAAAGGQGLSEEERDEVEKKLKGLGYL